jgi:lysine-specific demethylase/histidyl-hydroxylase NO66
MAAIHIFYNLFFSKRSSLEDLPPKQHKNNTSTEASRVKEICIIYLTMKIDKANTNDTGSGMSRAAKKRAKKKQKTDAGGVAAATGAVDDSNKKRPASNNGAPENDKSFNSKRIKSIIKDISASIGVGGLVEDSPAKAKEEPNSDDENENFDDEPEVAAIGASLPVTSVPPLPPGTTLQSILMINPDEKHSQQNEIFDSMTAKERAASLLQTILNPITLQEFYQGYWEKKPLVSKATLENKARFQGLLSLKSIRAMTKQHDMFYGQDLNVTKYKKGSDGVNRRITLDKLAENEGGEAVKANTSELWSNYDDGCTIRLLCPHKHNDACQALLSNLETEFQCMVGANAYLTPPKSSQGFAPHYDDIEAFCLQLEGSKRWKVYKPILKLPRVSSEDFTPEDVQGMEQVMDVTLEEGDLLYMPRGWIHQAFTLKDDNQHSLHLTVSAMQQWAWVDLMELIMPDALEAAATSETSSSLRQGLPRGFMEYMGVMYEEAKDDKMPESMKRDAQTEAMENSKRKEQLMMQERFRAEAKKLVMKIAKTAMDMIDATCDQMAKRFISERQPPALTQKEKELTSQGDEVADETPILPNTLCRLVRPGIGRLVLEDDKAVVYHCADNSRIYMENPLSPLEFEMDDGPALEQLLTTAEPDWILVNDLYHDTIEDKISITQALYDEGILAIKQQDEMECGR